MSASTTPPLPASNTSATAIRIEPSPALSDGGYSSNSTLSDVSDRLSEKEAAPPTPATPVVKRGRGRPRKVRVVSPTPSEGGIPPTPTLPDEQGERGEEEAAPPTSPAPVVKRKRGRPRKVRPAVEEDSQPIVPNSDVKRGRGRSRNDSVTMGGNRQEIIPNRETARRPTRKSRRLQEQHDPDEQGDGGGEELNAWRTEFKHSFRPIFSRIRTSHARRADPSPTPSPVPCSASRKKKKPRFKRGSYPVRHNARTYEARNEAAKLEDGEVDYDNSTDIDEAHQRTSSRRKPPPRWAPYVPYVHEPVEIPHVEEPEVEDMGSHVAEALHFMDLD
jgi:hypothetical protein